MTSDSTDLYCCSKRVSGNINVRMIDITNIGGLPLITYATRGRGGGSSILYISFAYYMQKGGRGSE